MSRTGRPLALLGALALLVSAFLPWAANGRTALDLGLLTYGSRLTQPTVALALVLLAGLPAVAALLDDHGWPRGIAAVTTGVLVVVWLARGPDGAITAGVGWAIGAAAALLAASAVAEPRRRAEARYPEDTDRGAPPTAEVTAPALTPATGSRIVPSGTGRTIEAWGLTRATCFAQAVTALTDGVVPTHGPDTMAQVPVRLDGQDDAQLLLALIERVIGLLRDGRVVTAVDLFDTSETHLVGYLDVAEVDLADTSVVPTLLRTQVEADRDWRAHVALG